MEATSSERKNADIGQLHDLATAQIAARGARIQETLRPRYETSARSIKRNPQQC